MGIGNREQKLVSLTILAMSAKVLTDFSDQQLPCALI